MALVEGVGDEVSVLCGLLLLLAALLLAWLSTHSSSGQEGRGPESPPPARGPEEAAAPSQDSVRLRGLHSPGAPDTITLRLKFLNDTERTVTVRPSDTVLHIKRSQFPGQEPRVRLIYQGQLLREDTQTVASLQLADGCVLHCHLSQHAPASGAGGADSSQDSINIGSLMVPLFLLLLGLLWYCHFQYPQVFSATATAGLGAMTLFVLVLVFSSYRR